MEILGTGMTMVMQLIGITSVAELGPEHLRNLERTMQEAGT